MSLDRVAIPNNILDRIDELERRLADLESYAAMATVDGETEGGTTYVQVTQEVEIGEGPGIDITGSSPTQTVGMGLDLPLLVHGDGSPAEEYATIAAALAAASGGDTIWLPPGTYSGDVTIPAGVTLVGMSREDCILTGQVTLGDGSVLENLSVIRTANDANQLEGVMAPTSGTAKIYRCNISVSQSGSGNAYAVSVESAGSLEVWGCYLYGSSASGIGYGGSRTGGGSLYIYGGRCIGSSYPLSE